MKINKINQDKILKAIELVCPLLKNDLIEEAYVVGSVAKGTAKVESDVDVYLINSKFEGYDTQLYSDSFRENVKKVIDHLKNRGIEFRKIETKKQNLIRNFYYQIYKNEIFHFMYDYESESVKDAGEYIEINDELCDEINELV